MPDTGLYLLPYILTVLIPILLFAYCLDLGIPKV